VAKQKRKPATQPTSIIRHPLFPAVVALWFGALFGLGSLAIRTGLIETLVIKTHIDTLVPATAPPLGITAKIVIALAMAVFGGLLGSKLAKFITRPNPDAHQRKRGAASIAETDVRRRDAHPDAPARRPISAHEEFGGEGIETETAPATIPGRRRALTVEAEQSVFHVPEFAPLPGGEPQMIDLGELDLAGSEIEALETEPRIETVDLAPVNQDFLAQDEVQEPRQVFGQPVVPGQPFAPPVPDFVVTAAAPRPVEPIANYGAPVAPPIDFSRPGEVIAAANAARTEEAPLFQRSADAAGFAEAGPQISIQTAITAEAVAEAAAVALDSLGLVELTERFAATLRKRRAALAASAAAIEVPLTVEPVMANPNPESANEPDDFSVQLFEVPAFLVPEAAVAVEAEQIAPPAAEPAPPVFEHFASVPVAAEVAEQESAEPVASLAMPAALRPISFDDPGEDEDFATYLPLRHIPMPQVRQTEESPVGAAPVPQEYSPPVQPSFEAPSAEIEPVSAVVPEAFVPDIHEPEVTDESQADGYSSLLNVAKPAASRQEFVRIEEPELESAAIEPVVIFPGQTARQNFGQAATFDAPSPAPSAIPVAEVATTAPAVDAGPLRRFDAPSSAAAGQAVAAQTSAPVQDSAETERALRAALATLQRMSGAA
jgi:hypothetical protein